MSATKSGKLIELHSPSEIPLKMTEEEEHRFWETHCLGEELVAQMESPGDDDLPPPRQQERGPLARILGFAFVAVSLGAAATMYAARKAAHARR